MEPGHPSISVQRSHLPFYTWTLGFYQVTGVRLATVAKLRGRLLLLLLGAGNLNEQNSLLTLNAWVIRST